MDAVHDRAAAAYMVRDILDVGRAEHSGRQIEAGDLDANAMTLAEQIGHREDFDCVFLDLAGCHLSPRRACQLVPGLPRF